MRVRAALPVMALLAVGVMAHGQTTPAPTCDATAKGANCPAPTAAPPKNTAQQFPFPGEDSSTPDRPADVTPDAPDAPSPDKTSRPPLPPFPGEPNTSAKGDSSGSSSSSSSQGESDASSPDSPDAPDPLKDAGSNGEDTKVTTHRKKIPKVNPETPESRAAEDLTVAEFYSNDGNYKAAYLRARDAVENQPNDPYTHFALAEAARKLGKRDEAKEQYAAVLKLDPIPKQLKESQKALEELSASTQK